MTRPHSTPLIVNLVSNHLLHPPNPPPSPTPRPFQTAVESAAPSSGAAEEEYDVYARGKFFGPLEVKDGVAIIRLDGPAKMNTISDELLAEAKVLWSEQVEPNPNIKAAVFISSKPDNFIAGADIQMIKRFEDKTQLKDLCMAGHDFFDRLKQDKKPLVAAIHGVCLGGGLEWALKCDYRIATSSSKTKMGLPEVMLGLLPGWGGTQNLPALVGFEKAAPMILQGKELRSDAAKKAGLVDQVVDIHALEQVAIDCAKGLAEGTLKRKEKKKSWKRWALEDTPIGRSMFWKEVDKQLAKTGGHYPAAYAIRDAMQYGQSGAKSKRDALEFEANKFVELAQTDVSTALIGLYDGMNAVKKNRFGEPAVPVKTVAVLGAGLMGAGIAQVSAEKGLKVLLKDRDAASLAGPFGESYIGENWDAKVKRKKMSAFQRNDATAKIVPLTDDLASTPWPRHFAKADMVIEAVPENLDLKHKVMATIEAEIPDHCVFASNTSVRFDWIFLIFDFPFVLLFVRRCCSFACLRGLFLSKLVSTLPPSFRSSPRSPLTPNRRCRSATLRRRASGRRTW